MEIILIILTSTIISALLFVAYNYGLYIGRNEKSNEGLKVTEDNKEFIEEMMAWKNFDGRR